MPMAGIEPAYSALRTAAVSVGVKSLAAVDPRGPQIRHTALPNKPHPHPVKSRRLSDLRPLAPKGKLGSDKNEVR